MTTLSYQGKGTSNSGAGKPSVPAVFECERASPGLKRPPPNEAQKPPECHSQNTVTPQVTAGSPGGRNRRSLLRLRQGGYESRWGPWPGFQMNPI